MATEAILAVPTCTGVVQVQLVVGEKLHVARRCCTLFAESMKANSAVFPAIPRVTEMELAMVVAITGLGTIAVDQLALVQPLPL